MAAPAESAVLHKDSIVESPEFRAFRAAVPRKQVAVSSKLSWSYYQTAGLETPDPSEAVIFIHGVSGTAEVFFRQLMFFSTQPVRAVAVQSPPVYDVDDWCAAFAALLDTLDITRCHLVGISLGGYLAQHFAHFRPDSVVSLVLVNSFCDTALYANNAPCMSMFGWMPEFVLKNMILNNYPQGDLEPRIAESVDFMTDQLDALTKKDVVSRLTLNCTEWELQPAELPGDMITIIDVCDEVAIPDQVRDEVGKFYPDAHVALLKDGGNFPNLSRGSEVNMHLVVHLRRAGALTNPTETDHVGTSGGVAEADTDSVGSSVASSSSSSSSSFGLGDDVDPFAGTRKPRKGKKKKKRRDQQRVARPVVDAYDSSADGDDV